MADAFTFTESLFPDGVSYPDVAWAQDSHSVVIITPSQDGFLYGEEVYIRVYTDGVVIPYSQELLTTLDRHINLVGAMCTLLSAGVKYAQLSF